MAVGSGSKGRDAWGDRPDYQSGGGIGGWVNDAMGGRRQGIKGADLGEGYAGLKDQMGESAKGAAANAAKWANRDMDIQDYEQRKNRAAQTQAIGGMQDAAGMMRGMAQRGDPAAEGMIRRGADEASAANMAALRGASAGAAQMGMARQSMMQNAAMAQKAGQDAAEANTRARMAGMQMYGQQTGAIAGQHGDMAKQDAAFQAARMQAWLHQQQNAMNYGLGAQQGLAGLYGRELDVEQRRLNEAANQANAARQSDVNTGKGIIGGIANLAGSLFSG